MNSLLPFRVIAVGTFSKGFAIAFGFAVLSIGTPVGSANMGMLLAQEALVDEEMLQSLAQPPQADLADDDATAVARPSGIDLLSLIGRGGHFMIPIGLMSLLVVTLSVERLISLRRKRVIPARLVERLEDLTNPIEKFDPSAAYKACQQNPSTAAQVVRAMLERLGQPLAEIERAAIDTVQRSADSLSGPIRWLNLAAAATPLMGLLGTVWGMIVAFHESTTLSAERSRSEQLSEGIYTALVTTLAGLVVAIPAAILAQYLENRLTKLLHRAEEMAFDLAPAFLRFTGRYRFEPTRGLIPLETAVAQNATKVPPPAPAAGPPAAPPVAATANHRSGHSTGAHAAEQRSAASGG